MFNSTVTIKLTNVWLYVVGRLPSETTKELQIKLSFVVPGFRFMPSYKAAQEKADATGEEPEWDGTKTVARITEYGDIRCPTGLLSMVREFLKEKDIHYQIEDKRLPAVVMSGWSTEGLTLRDYQKEASDKALNSQRGVLQLATGGGKTPLSANMIVRAAAFPAMFYVPSCDLLEQTYDTFMRYIRFNGLPVKIGRIGAGNCDIQQINIATVQSCQLALSGKFTKYKYDDVDQEDDKAAYSAQQKNDIKTLIKEAQFVTADECQHVSSETIQTVLNNSHKARYRFGMSASPWRDDGLDILIEACFGRRLCSISASYLIQNGFLIKPRIIFNHFQQFLGATANFNAHYTKFVVENELRNQWIAERTKFHVERDRPTIILVKWARHAELLAEIIPDSRVLTSSGKNKLTAKKRKEYLNDMRERKLMTIIGTTLLDEGVDVPAAGAGILAGGGKSSTRALQRVGRFIRKDENDASKDTAYIEEFFDHCRWLDHHARARRRIYDTEPLFEIGDNQTSLS